MPSWAWCSDSGCGSCTLSAQLPAETGRPWLLAQPPGAPQCTHTVQLRAAGSYAFQLKDQHLCLRQDQGK